MQGNIQTFNSTENRKYEADFSSQRIQSQKEELKKTEIPSEMEFMHVPTDGTNKIEVPISQAQSRANIIGPKIIPPKITLTKEIVGSHLEASMTLGLKIHEPSSATDRDREVVNTLSNNSKLTAGQESPKVFRSIIIGLKTPPSNSLKSIGNISTLKHMPSLALEEKIPAKSHSPPSSKGALKKLTWLGLGQIFIVLCIAIASAFLTNVQQGRSFYVFVTLGLDGFLHSIFIISMFQTVITKHSKHNFKKLFFLHAFVIAQSTVLSAGFNLLCEEKQSIYWFIFSKILAVIAATCFYLVVFGVIYLQSCRKNQNCSKTTTPNHSKSSSGLYLNFLEDLKNLRSQLKLQKSQNSPSQNRFQSPRSGDSSPILVARSPDSTSHIKMGEKAEISPFSPLKILGLGIFLILPFVQLMLSVSSQLLFDYLGETTHPGFSYIVCVAYPTVIGLCKNLMELVNKKFNLEIDCHLEFISLAFAALPYRALFFSLDSLTEAAIVIGIKIWYKVMVYIVAQIVKKRAKRLTRKCFKKRKEKTIQPSKTSYRKSRSATRELRTTIITIDGLSEKQRKTKANFNAASRFVSKFIVLEFCDVYDLIAFTSIFAIFKFIPYENPFKSLTSSEYNSRLLFAGIELGVDLALWVIILLSWRKIEHLNKIKIAKCALKFFREIKWVFLTVNLTLFFSLYMLVYLSG